MQLSCSLREICHLIHITAESAHELQLKSQQKCVCVCVDVDVTDVTNILFS